MTLTPYQIVTPLIALLLICYAWNLVMRQRKTIWEALLWTLFWGTIATLAVWPEFVDYLSTITGIRKGENAVLVTFLGILSFIVFSLVIRLEKLEQRQTRLVRKIALKDATLEENET